MCVPQNNKWYHLEYGKLYGKGITFMDPIKIWFSVLTHHGWILLTLLDKISLFAREWYTMISLYSPTVEYEGLSVFIMIHSTIINSYDMSLMHGFENK